MTANEIAQMVRAEPYHTNLNRNVIADFIDQQADRIAELEKEADRLSNHANELRKIHANRIAELESKLQESALDYISVCSQADEHYARVQELEKQLDEHKK